MRQTNKPSVGLPPRIIDALLILNSKGGEACCPDCIEESDKALATLKPILLPNELVALAQAREVAQAGHGKVRFVSVMQGILERLNVLF